MSKRRPTKSSDRTELERRIRSCREKDCEDGYRIRVEEETKDFTGTGQRDLDGNLLTVRVVRTRYATPCPSCNPEPRQAEQKPLPIVDEERVHAAQRSAGA